MGGPGFTELLIFLLLIVAGIVVLFLTVGKRRSGRANVERDDGDARRVLDERYVRGEIDRDEYEQIRRDIQAE